MVELLQVHSGDTRTSSVHHCGDLTFSLPPVNNISKDVSSYDYSDWQLTCRSCPSAPGLNNLITKDPGVKTYILYVPWESERTVMTPSSGSNPRPKDLMLSSYLTFKKSSVWPIGPTAKVSLVRDSFLQRRWNRDCYRASFLPTATTICNTSPLCWERRSIVGVSGHSTHWTFQSLS